ncbi:MAG: hypothetical protein IJP42_01165 [Selenomonadaceae bacterium]|nr:hypothetical protein [Selenomonadaceae bacterium]
MFRVMTPFTILKNPIFWIFPFAPKIAPQKRVKRHETIFEASKPFSKLQSHFQSSKTVFKAPKSLSKLQNRFQSSKTVFKAPKPFSSTLNKKIRRNSFRASPFLFSAA